VPIQGFAVQSTEEQAIRQFMFKMQSVMNKRNRNEMNTFFSYYADSTARFQKTSYLLDSDNTSKIIAQESLDMNKDEYIQYLKDVLESLSYYFFKITVDSIKIDNVTNVALVSYRVDEYGLTEERKLDENNKPITNANFISANCNMNLSIESGDTMILSSNCVEKIVKKRQ
jgi:hypothetical protein